MSDDFDLSFRPWPDVEAVRGAVDLQQRHPVVDGKREHLATAAACPVCRTTADELAWFYYESPRPTWENLWGCAGWMTVCDKCDLVVDFFIEIIS